MIILFVTGINTVKALLYSEGVIHYTAVRTPEQKKVSLIWNNFISAPCIAHINIYMIYKNCNYVLGNFSSSYSFSHTHLHHQFLILIVI